MSIGQESYDDHLFHHVDEDDDETRDESHRGEILGGARASVCPGFEPNRLRYLYYNVGLRFLLMIVILAELMAVASVRSGYSVWLVDGWFWGVLACALFLLGGVLSLYGLAISILLIMGSNSTANYFKNALLTPGVIVSRDPLGIVVLASLSNGSGEEYHGLQRIDREPLPYHDHAVGTRVPMVTCFHRVEGLDRWMDFMTEPISWGTGRRANIERCFERLGNREFARLEACLDRGLIPQDDDTLLLLDKDDRLLDSFSIKDERKKYGLDDR